MFDLHKKDASAGSTNQPKGQDNAPEETESASRIRSGSADFAVIGRSIKLDGDLRGDEDLRIEGDVSGTIQLPNHHLTIGKEGRVKADAYARSVTVDGEVTGDLYASECVSVRANANVKGNVVATRVSLEEGARFKGSIDMDPKSVESALDEHGIQKPARTAGRLDRAKQATLANVKSGPTKSGASQRTASEKSVPPGPAH